MHISRISIWLVLFTVATLISCNEGQKTGENSPLQNIVFIIGDDHAAYALGCYGNMNIKTPNLDKMAARGVRFTHAYANAPMCSASRQSILTGKYPHASGVTLLRTSFPDTEITIAEHLKQFGYTTGIIGKNHFNNNLSHGFDTLITRRDFSNYIQKNRTRTTPDSISVRPPWKPFRDHSRVWLNAEMLPSQFYDEESSGTYLANKAVDFIEVNQNNKFCLWLGFHEPHSPFNFPIEYTGKYQPENMPFPTGSPEDDRWIPLEFKDLTEDERRGIIAAYYTSVEYLDKNIGLVLDKLESLGLDENTMVVYIGDHGYLLNHHKRFEKHMMWEEAVQAPLIIQSAGKYGEGKAFDQQVEFVDLVPTILDELGIHSMDNLQGKSLLPLLKQENNQHKPYIFSEFLADNKAMVRTPEWKYIFTSGKRDLAQGYATGNPPSGILHRLYDQQNDPNEHSDVAAASENQEVLANLQSALLDWFMQTHPKAEDLPEGLSLDEQLSWFCEPPDASGDLDAK